MKILEKFLNKKALDEIRAALGDKLAEVDKLTEGITIDTAEQQFIPKGKFDAEREKIKRLEEQAAKHAEQLEKLKTEAGASADMKNQIAELQKANDTAAKEAAAKLAATEREYAMRDALKNTHKAHDALSVLPHLKQETIIYKDGVFTGLDEQVKALKESKAFLFADDGVQAGTGGAPGSPGAGGGAQEMTLAQAVAASLKQ